jgi:hypothetical protein
VAVNTPDILLLRKDLENHHYTELRGKSLDWGNKGNKENKRFFQFHVPGNDKIT